MKIEFTKMHGLGNDFVVIDNMDGKISLTPEQVVFICDRHKGIGADGVILVESSDKVDSAGSPQADCFMNYMNADGSKAQMCGNGVRCVAKFLRDFILKNHNSFQIETRAGVKQIEYKNDGTFCVNMGQALISSKDFPSELLMLEGLELNFVSVGNPFAIAFVDDIEKYNFQLIGRAIENNKNFPNRINFELVEQTGKREFKMRIWERGCGETLACGSGSCAVYALATSLNKSQGIITIESPGGKVVIFSDDNSIIMQGPAETVFSGFLTDLTNS